MNKTLFNLPCVSSPFSVPSNLTIMGVNLATSAASQTLQKYRIYTSFPSWRLPCPRRRNWNVNLFFLSLISWRTIIKTVTNPIVNCLMNLLFEELPIMLIIKWLNPALEKCICEERPCLWLWQRNCWLASLFVFWCERANRFIELLLADVGYD